MTQSLPVYAPQALFKLNDAIDEKRDQIDEKVRRLGETASLDAAELAKVLGYKEKLRLRRWSEYWADVLAQRHGKIELPERLLDNALQAPKPAATSAKLASASSKAEAAVPVSA